MPAQGEREARAAARVPGGSSIPAVVHGAVCGAFSGISAECDARLLADAEAAYAARVGRQQRGSAPTFWVGAAAAPRCLLEALALTVFRKHADGVSYDPRRSGAEWWVLSLDSDGRVVWHWDGDWESLALNVYPHVSTVTYLGDVGAPTLVVGAPQLQPRAERCRLWACGVARGRHLAFDGRYLHGAPAELAPPPGGPRRVTFLVNVWFDFAPSTSWALPDAAAAAMAPPALADGIQIGDLVAGRPWAAGSGGVVREWAFGAEWARHERHFAGAEQGRVLCAVFPRTLGPSVDGLLQLPAEGAPWAPAKVEVRAAEAPAGDSSDAAQGVPEGKRRRC